METTMHFARPISAAQYRISEKLWGTKNWGKLDFSIELADYYFLPYRRLRPVKKGGES